MKRNNKVVIAVLSAVAVLAVSTVIASSQASHTPLYTFRMEQASSKMNFLPTAVNGFAYMTRNGCTLNYSAAGYCGGILLDVTEGRTCDGTCFEPTCENTCMSTCAGNPTCSNTCPNTCSSTCDTCEHTCATCNYTCYQPTCSEVTCNCIHQ